MNSSLLITFNIYFSKHNCFTYTQNAIRERDTFDVNERTVRRDLSKEKGIVDQFFGGTRLIEVNKAEKFRTIEKRQIAF
ncbi:hypothetical protein L4D21_09510 [Photobacterium profundum]|uniref:hypothetical protein n=1 Tax=Photobacterium profundum TaxID=74109 RepID=UPI003D0A7AE1